MDLSFLDKSSRVTPMLVRLYDSHKLYGLAKDKKPLARAELTSAVSELMDMELSDKERDLIADVLVELLRQAEIELRQALSERLSARDDIPLRLALRLANDEILVADPVLRQSPVLGDLDLIYIIKSKGPEYWQAIATRREMSDQVINTLAETRDFDTAVNLAENASITLTEASMLALSDLAQNSDVLARPLLRREEVPADMASRLYHFVGTELKKFIRDNYEVDTETLLESVDEMVLELVDAAEQKSEFEPTGAMQNAAKRFQEKGLLTMKLMLGTLRRGQIQAFVAQFAEFTNLDAETVETILSQSNGQGLAVACKALDIIKDDFVSIFLLTNRVRNKGKMVDIKDMKRAIDYYNRIEKDVAESIMRNSLAVN